MKMNSARFSIVYLLCLSETSRAIQNNHTKFQSPDKESVKYYIGKYFGPESFRDVLEQRNPAHKESSISTSFDGDYLENYEFEYTSYITESSESLIDGNKNINDYVDQERPTIDDEASIVSADQEDKDLKETLNEKRPEKLDQPENFNLNLHELEEATDALLEHSDIITKPKDYFEISPDYSDVFGSNLDYNYDATFDWDAVENEQTDAFYVSDYRPPERVNHTKLNFFINSTNYPNSTETEKINSTELKSDEKFMLSSSERYSPYSAEFIETINSGVTPEEVLLEDDKEIFINQSSNRKVFKNRDKINLNVHETFQAFGPEKFSMALTKFLNSTKTKDIIPINFEDDNITNHKKYLQKESFQAGSEFSKNANSSAPGMEVHGSMSGIQSIFSDKNLDAQKEDPFPESPNSSLQFKKDEEFLNVIGPPKYLPGDPRHIFSILQNLTKLGSNFNILEPEWNEQWSETNPETSTSHENNYAQKRMKILRTIYAMIEEENMIKGSETTNEMLNHLLYFLEEMERTVEQLPEETECPQFYYRVGNMCMALDFLDSYLDYHEARLYCQIVKGGDLVMFRDANEFANIQLLIRELDPLREFSYWIGLSDEEHEGQWKFLDGRIIRFGAPFWGVKKAYCPMCRNPTLYSLNDTRDDTFPSRRKLKPEFQNTQENYGCLVKHDFHYLHDVSSIQAENLNTIPLCQYIPERDEKANKKKKAWEEFFTNFEEQTEEP